MCFVAFQLLNCSSVILSAQRQRLAWEGCHKTLISPNHPTLRAQPLTAGLHCTALHSDLQLQEIIATEESEFATVVVLSQLLKVGSVQAS